jgi:nucleotide-binding universal stress UspA family protein
VYRRILVPLDGSHRAEAILPYIEEMAHQFSSSVILFQVMASIRASLLNPDPYIDDYIKAQEEEQERQVMQYLNSRCGQLRSKKINARAIAVRGPVVRTIIETAAYQNVDVIAMARHGRTGLSRVYYGSVAAGVLHLVDRPLLLIRADG